MVKRFCDLLIAAASLVILAPLLGFLAMLIRLRGDGPIFYLGTRVGRFGKPFRIVKFRTMVSDAESRGGSCTSMNDTRITPLGRWMREFKLDELPQLFNVLKGDMSFVGPRPELQKYTDMFNNEEMQILSVQPGITDWATLWNPDEEAILARSSDPERTYLEEIRPEKVRLQLKYVRERGLWADFKILISTAALLLKRCLVGGSPQRLKRGHSRAAES